MRSISGTAQKQISANIPPIRHDHGAAQRGVTHPIRAQPDNLSVGQPN